MIPWAQLVRVLSPFINTALMRLSPFGNPEFVEKMAKGGPIRALARMAVRARLTMDAALKDSHPALSKAINDKGLGREAGKIIRKEAGKTIRKEANKAWRDLGKK